jgi:hypothetical protein
MFNIQRCVETPFQDFLASSWTSHHKVKFSYDDDDGGREENAERPSSTRLYYDAVNGK